MDLEIDWSTLLVVNDIIVVGYYITFDRGNRALLGMYFYI
jgi:hypothetical protein